MGFLTKTKLRCFHLTHLITTLVLVNFMAIVQAETLTLEQVLQQAIDNNIGLKIADLGVQKSQLERDKVEAMLGINLNASAKTNHDVSFLGTPSNRLDSTVSASKLLAQGIAVSLSGRYSYENADLTFSKSLPNPNHTTSLDLQVSQPLWRGKDNIAYIESLANSGLSEKMAQLQNNAIREQLANQVTILFHGIALLSQQVKNIEQGIQRTDRMIRHIKNNQSLGLSERKDILQIEAQKNAQLAEKQNLLVNLQQQQINLNRLLGRDANSEIQPLLGQQAVAMKPLDESLDKAKQASTLLALQKYKIELAESVIRLNQDAKKDRLNAFATLGSRSSHGENGLGQSIGEFDWAGSVGVEFQQAMDKRGVNANLSQARLDRSVALHEERDLVINLEFQVKGLVAEIHSVKLANDAANLRLQSEHEKLIEAEQRYKTGRATTMELIRFENEFASAELVLNLKRIELQTKVVQLDVLTGDIWQRVVALPK